MAKDYNYYVYIMANISRVIYIGVTNDLIRRVMEHQAGEVKGFTKRYKTRKLVYYEHFFDIRYAIQREKELKGWRRSKKVALIEKENSNWRDLFKEITQ